jgi:hypothetical protein
VKGTFSRATILELADTFPPEEPLRSTFLSAPAVRVVLNRYPGPATSRHSERSFNPRLARSEGAAARLGMKRTTPQSLIKRLKAVRPARALYGVSNPPAASLPIATRHVCRDLVSDPSGRARPVMGKTGVPFEAATLCHGTEVA